MSRAPEGINKLRYIIIRVRPRTRLTYIPSLSLATCRGPRRTNSSSAATDTHPRRSRSNGCNQYIYISSILKMPFYIYTHAHACTNSNPIISERCNRPAPPCLKSRRYRHFSQRLLHQSIMTFIHSFIHSCMHAFIYSLSSLFLFVNHSDCCSSGAVHTCITAWNAERRTCIYKRPVIYT